MMPTTRAAAARRCLCGWLVLATLALNLSSDAAEPATIDFGRDVRPILAEHCWSCHSGDEPQADLKLNEHSAALAVITPGEPDESELIRRLTSEDVAERMPPEGEEALAPEQIAVLRRWIQAGAPWAEHWAFQPLMAITPPQVADEAWVRNEIDQFILAGLEARQWTPAPEADRATLIKRLYYDLLGLPPPLDEVDAFVNDPASDAYQRLVERLLGSPHFGERWGRHWLDLAHYADSDGYEKDRARPDAYLYRDWVIDALNADMPFDQFTIEQLAGDLLPGATPQQHVATGFLRQTLTNEEGGVDQEEYRVNAVFDRTETVGTVWLALTVNCVRCHTHKYDPLPHEEYYRLYAFFNNAEEVTRELPLEARNLQELHQQLVPLEARLAERLRQLAPTEQAWATEQHRRILAESDHPLRTLPLEIASVHTADDQPLTVRIEQHSVLVAPADAPAGSAAAPEKADYVVRGPAPAESITGLKLWALPHEQLPARGPGRAANGNFVLTGLKAYVVAPGGERQPLPLHRVQSSFAQRDYPAAASLQSAPPHGWAIAPQVGQEQWIQFRTVGEVSIPEGAELEIVLEQQYGDAHTLGHFRLDVLTGDERGLHLPEVAIADILEMYPEKRIYSQRETLSEYYVQHVAQDAEVRRLREEIRALQRDAEARLVSVRTVAAPRLERATHVMYRGDFLSPTTAVHPGVPEVLSRTAPFDATGSTASRLDLARWLVHPDNPLTPRVAVNRVWQHLLGAPLVGTPNDFGTRGQSPTHPELLDWLAGRFQRELRWSHKALIRQIVQSATYRQASAARPTLEPLDPLNTLLFRQNRFRVEGEIVRDLHLAVSGLLTARVGGPSVFPPMPDDLAKLSYANSFSWTNSTGADRYRRGLYTFFKRTVPHPNLMTFDAPDANVACVERTVSNTPLQALLLLNNEVHVEAARAFARHAAASADNDAARVAVALRTCVARDAEPAEIETLLGVLAASRAYYAQRPDEAQQLAGPEPSPMLHPEETAAWVATLRVVLNLDEFITRE